ncbi:MAG: DUF2800 domain-containing protein [Akkermansia sp.]|nr:DUF2800 domain-containing protein [Akkermansia sp.]
MSEDDIVEPEDPRGGKPSASGMQRIALCPGSWMAERAYPEESSEAAEMGTRLHKHMELGTLPEDPEEAEAVEWCRTQERLLVEKYVSGIGCPSSPEERTSSGYAEAPGLRSSGPSVLREVRWWAADGSFSGQGDVAYVHDGCALIVDYKFGRVPVPAAASNMQLAALAKLAFDNLADINVVFCAILQPFASRQEPRVVRYQLADVPQLRRYFGNLLAEAARPGARRVPGEEQCRYCRARAACPACSELMVRETQADVAALWADWSPEKKAEAVRLAGLAKKWAEAVERRAKADLKAGFAIPGFRLSAGRKSFKITDAQGAFGQLNALIGLTGEEFAGCCTVKISALDKVVHGKLAEQAPEGVKQLVKKSAEWLRDVLEDYGAESVSEGSIMGDD